MTYSEKYPLYIKSAVYMDLDATDDSVSCTVVYADDSVDTYAKPEELIAVSLQLQAQQEALNAGEVLSYQPK